MILPSLVITVIFTGPIGLVYGKSFAVPSTSPSKPEGKISDNIFIICLAGMGLLLIAFEAPLIVNSTPAPERSEMA